MAPDAMTPDASGPQTPAMRRRAAAQANPAPAGAAPASLAQASARALDSPLPTTSSTRPMRNAVASDNAAPKRERRGRRS